MDTSLGVVIPLANEETTVVDLIGRVLKQLGEADRVFCVLDNASKDNTRQLVEQFGETDGRIVCVWAPENRCVVDAYFAGYRAALAAECEWILEMDGGLSHCPEEITRFQKQLDKGYDYIGGCRFIGGGSHCGGFKRYWLSRFGTMLANLFLRTKMKDMTGGFQCFSQVAMRHVVNKGVTSRAHFFQTEIKYMMREWNWIEVPINYNSSSPSVRSNVLWDAIQNLVLLRFNADKPIRNQH